MLAVLMSLPTALLPDRRPGREPTQGSRPDPHHQPTEAPPFKPNLHRCWLPTRTPPQPRPPTQQAATQHAATQQALRAQARCPPGMVSSILGSTTEHRSSIHAPHDPQVACNSDDRTFRGTPTNVAIPTTPFQTLETRLWELHATFPRHHNIRHRKGLQRHHAQPSARNPQRLEDAYDTRNPGSLTRPRVQPRHEDTNDAG